MRHLRWRVSFAFTSGGAPKCAYSGLNWPISQKNPQKFASIFRSIGTHACSLSEQAVFFLSCYFRRILSGFYFVSFAGYYPAFLCAFLAHHCASYYLRCFPYALWSNSRRYSAEFSFRMASRGPQGPLSLWRVGSHFSSPKPLQNYIIYIVYNIVLKA